MRDAVLFIMAVLLVGGGYGYTKNPKACQKLGADWVSDVKAIYLPAGSTPPGSDGTSTADVDTNAPVAPAPAVAVVPPAPPHFPMGYVAPMAAPPATPTTLPSPAPAQAPATGALRYAGRLPSFTDYDQALAAARTRHVPLLVLFTGSDWCHYCQMLEQEVLTTPDFQNYVAGHFVFVTIDDLRNTPVPDDEKKQISDLERKFGVNGFPSMLVLDNNEHTLGGVEGYEPGSGPSAVTGKLDALAAKFTN